MDGSSARRVVASNDNAFRSAQRHSTRVRFLKIILPTLAVVMLGGFFAYTYVIAPRGFSVDFADSTYTDGKLVMANPKLEGFTRDNLRYSMTAARAIQDVTGDAPIALELINATLPVDATVTATVEAATGLYDRAGNTLDVNSPMTVTTTDGLVAKLTTAQIDMGSGSLSTNDPVDIAQQGTRITADSMRVIDNGATFVFDRRVKVMLEPRNGAAAQDTRGTP